MWLHQQQLMPVQWNTWLPHLECNLSCYPCHEEKGNPEIALILFTFCLLLLRFYCCLTRYTRFRSCISFVERIPSSTTLSSSRGNSRVDFHLVPLISRCCSFGNHLPKSLCSMLGCLQPLSSSFAFGCRWSIYNLLSSALNHRNAQRLPAGLDGENDR